MKPALMIIDMQKEYFNGFSKISMIDASEYINEVLGYFRAKNLPIIWVQDIDKESGIIPDTVGFELIDILKKSEDEISIFKEYGNSFNKTECENILKNKNVDVIFITGYCAEHCVLSTYRGAQDCDFTPVIVKNGIASGDKDNLGFVEKITDTISYNILRKILEDIKD
jgi:nicotinamidase-related amidase